MAGESELLEFYFDSSTLRGLFRSGLFLLRARRFKPRNAPNQNPVDLPYIAHHLLYAGLVVIPGVLLELFQLIRTQITGKPKEFPQGSWQFYLHWKLREDLAHHTNETTGYYAQRPADATELDDLTAWVMTIIQFLWGYEDLMGRVWDEATMLRLVGEAAVEAGRADEALFRGLTRQWEVARPFGAPLNGTYADVRRGTFEDFIAPHLEALPSALRDELFTKYKLLASTRRRDYQSQMSLLSRLNPGQFLDTKVPIPLWDARIGLVLGGHYFLIDVVSHNEQGHPVVYGPGGTSGALHFKDGNPTDLDGETLTLRGEQLFRAGDGEWAGYLDMPSAPRVKAQLQHLLSQPPGNPPSPGTSVDILLAETPRPLQKHLRGMLPAVTQEALAKLNQAPIILNWDARPQNTSLAELRRTHRGIGDHTLTIMRTENSIVFDQSHMFFDGTWSLAMAEVLTNAAVQWCKRCVTIAPSESSPPKGLRLEATPAFISQAQAKQQIPEISAETTIWDISQIFKLREILGKTGTRLTVNDLLVITRIFHAAHYRPSVAIQPKLDEFKANVQTPSDRLAAEAIDRSLERGRFTNPALLIPVDASPTDPQERIFPITFRNLSDSLVWVWDDTWEAYQAYRKFDPPDTPEGKEALRQFALKRTFLVGSLRAFSYVLDANKAVAMRGHSMNIAILKLLTYLPPWLQSFLNAIPEQFQPLSEIMKGDEVYSNVGRVAKGASLTRFMSAKDDGNTKALVWGVMSDDNNRLIVTMRDFRPHVKPLVRAGRIDLAHEMAQDYVTTYTSNLIGLVARLSAMLQAEAPPD